MPRSTSECGMLQVRVVVHLELVRHREDDVVVVERAGNNAADRLRVEWCRRRGWCGGAPSPALLHGDIELVRDHRARMARLRIRCDVRSRCADEEVEILHELAPLLHEHIATPLVLEKLECLYGAAVHEAWIPVGGRHRARWTGRRRH